MRSSAITELHEGAAEQVVGTCLKEPSHESRLNMVPAALLLLLVTSCGTPPASSASKILEGHSPLCLKAQVTYDASKDETIVEATLINCTDQILLLWHIGPEFQIGDWAAEDEDGSLVAIGGESGWRGPVCYRELGVAEAPGVYSSKTWPLVKRVISFEKPTRVTYNPPVAPKPAKIFRMTATASFRVRDSVGLFEPVSLSCRVPITRKP